MTKLYGLKTLKSFICFFFFCIIRYALAITNDQSSNKFTEILLLKENSFKWGRAKQKYAYFLQ